VVDPIRARRVKLLGLDVDGVLTDNGVYMGVVAGESVEFKRFDIQDGLGLAVTRLMGLEVVWVSGRSSPATTVRAEELGIELVQDSSARKLPAIEAMLARRGLAWDQMAFVGDDLADLPVFRRVGVPIAVANAVAEVKALAAHVTVARGGSGAVREAVEALLGARGEWDEGVRRYLRERDPDVEPVTG
jgi:3-deoxy-D-manno-octulosonate 8-phosphate phosphatase (KDO 8-P phosphatase)